MIDPFLGLLGGVIQGITEWLPVSSQGVLSLFFSLLTSASTEEILRIAFIFHAGTIGATLIYFRKEIIELLAKKPPARWTFMWWSIPISLLVGFVTFILLKEIAITQFFFLLSAAYFLTFLLLRSGHTLELSEKSAALVTGIGQGLAAIPGISRSGTTISLMLMTGTDPKETLIRSYLMSIPVVLAANGYLILSNPAAYTEFHLIGIVAAFVTGIISLSLLLRVAKKIHSPKFALLLAILTFLVGLAA